MTTRALGALRSVRAACAITSRVLKRLASPALAMLLAAAVALATVASCSKCGESSTDDPAQTMKATETPVPAPDGLLADVYIGTPNASWGKLQRGIGGAVGILPASAGGIICAAAGLDPFIASEIDGAAPFYGAVAGDPGNVSYVLALKLLDLRKARGTLVDGDASRYGSRDAGGMTELVAKGRGAGAGDGPPVAVAFSPNGYLLIARRSEDLGRLGPYVTRTLPKRPLPPEGAVVFDMPRAALGTLLKPRLEDLWGTARIFLLREDERMRRDHGGRAPDFGDPKAIVGAADAWVTRRIAVFGDLEKMRIAVDLVEEGISIVSTMTPAGGGGPAAKWTDAMSIGDVKPLAALPATAAAALFMRDNEEARAEQSVEIEKAVTSALGSRLAEADAKKLHDVIEDVTKARGDVMATALLWDEPQGLSLRGQVRDAEAATRAVRGAVDLVKVAPFKELLHVRDVTSSTEDVSGVGKASIVTLAREPGRDGRDGRGPRAARDGGAGPASPAPRAGGDAGAPSGAMWGIDASAPAAPRRPRKDELGLAWLVDSNVLTLATSDTPLATLSATVRPDRKLGDEPSVARSFTALGTTASTVLVVQPLRFDPTRANLPAAPLVIALGRKDKDATLRIDIANGLLREFARMQMGL